MEPIPDPAPETFGTSVSPAIASFRKATILLGAAIALIGVLGIFGLYSHFALLRSFVPGFQTIAFSTTIFVLFFGSVLISHSLKPIVGPARTALQLIFVLIALTGAVEFSLTIRGSHFLFERFMVSVGDMIARQPTTAISPGTLSLLVVAAIGFFLLLGSTRKKENRQRDNALAGIFGLVIALIGFTFMMGYVLGTPYLYGTPFIPVAAPATLAVFLLGLGLMTAAGPGVFPLWYFSGTSIRARLFRAFLPLTLVIILVESIINNEIVIRVPMSAAILVSASIVFFSLLTGYVVFRIAHRLGSAFEKEEAKRKSAEIELTRRNTELTLSNEELTATREELRTSRDELDKIVSQLTAIFDHTTNGIIVADMTGKIVYWNPAAIALHDFSSEDNRTRPFSEFTGDFEIAGLDGRELETKEWPIARILRGEVLRNVELRIARKGRDWKRIFSYGGRIAKDEKGEPSFVVLTVEDITERKRAEEALVRYRIFTENASDIILFIRPRDGHIIEANNAALLTYGYSREEMLTMTVFDLRPFNSAAEVEDQLARASVEGILFEAVHRKKDGSTIPVEVSSVAAMMDNEKVLISIVRDISERKRAEETRALLASIVTQSEDAIYGKTLDGIITSWNLGAEKVYGYTAEEAIGKPITFLAPPDHNAEIDYILGKVRAGEPIRSLETIRVRKDGEHINVSLSVSPVKNVNGELIGASTIAHDISNRKRSETALALANKKLGIMYSITRHDILNQITALQAYIYLYHEECPTEPQLEDYYQHLNKITKAIENQISFTKSYEEIGVKAPSWQSVREIADRVAGSGGFGGIRFTILVGTLEVYADPLLEKVFFNLYENARRHGEHVTEINITFRPGDIEGVLVVEDNGVGIPAPEKAMIFERGVGKHTGLGLFLIGEILAITGMSIKETGEPGKGARFEISVPKEAFHFGS